VSKLKPKIPHQPTPQELEDYIHDFKTNLVDEVNEEFPKLLNEANSTEVKLRSDLIIFASALITVMGAVIASKDLLLTSSSKVILLVAVISLLLSVIFGLAGYYTDAAFWGRLADYRHRGRCSNNRTMKIKNYYDAKTC
jgi:hypothetical protein